MERITGKSKDYLKGRTVYCHAFNANFILGPKFQTPSIAVYSYSPYCMGKSFKSQNIITSTS